MKNLVSKEFIVETVDLYSDTIVRIAFQYTKNKTDAEDIMQDVFLALLKQSGFNDKEHLKAWIIRVTINKSKNWLKTAKRRKTVSLGAAQNGLQGKESFYHLDADSMQEGLTQRQTEILDGISLLSQKDRDALYLFYYEGYTAREIGTITKASEKAVLMRLSRARKVLKEIWNAD